jgi:hypothetical protein
VFFFAFLQLWFASAVALIRSNPVALMMKCAGLAVLHQSQRRSLAGEGSALEQA